MTNDKDNKITSKLTLIHILGADGSVRYEMQEIKEGYPIPQQQNDWTVEVKGKERRSD